MIVYNILNSKKNFFTPLPIGKNNTKKGGQHKTCQKIMKNITFVFQIQNKRIVNQIFHNAQSNIISIN